MAGAATTTRPEAEALMTIGSGFHGIESGRPVGGAVRLADGRFDFLATPQAALALVRNGRNFWRVHEDLDIEAPDTPPTPTQLARLRLLRDAVQALAAKDDERFQRRLRELIGAYTFRLDRDGELRPTASGWDGFIARLLPVLIDAHEHADRIRLCANPNCRWAIFDLTKSGTRIWCHPTKCGNLMKVRAFRARAKARAGRRSAARGRSH